MPGKLFLVVADSTNLVTDLRVEDPLLEGLVRARSRPPVAGLFYRCLGVMTLAKNILVLMSAKVINGHSRRLEVSISVYCLTTPRFLMEDKAALTEIDRKIQIVEDNLRELIEQAAGFSGATDEERAAQRIADQQAKLDALLKGREALLR